MGEKPDELDRAFIAPFDETDFLWTSELFVARQPLDRIPERPRGERSELHGVIALDALLGPELQAKRRILASAIPRCRAKNSSVLTRILSRLNKPLGRPAWRRTVFGER